MNESPYVAMREFIRVAVELEVRKAMPETRAAASPPEVNIEELERRVWERIVPKLPTAPSIVQPKDGRDGVGIADVLMRDAGLVVRLTDGTERALGRVVGEKGDPGKDGKDGEPGKDGVASTVPGPKGEPGERGKDGIATREEINSLIEERVAEIQVRTFADIYQGVYDPAKTYTRGVVTTWGGSLWLAQVAEPKAKPGENGDWKLIVKAGRDARK